MLVSDHWEQLSPTDWKDFAQQWLAEIRGENNSEVASEAVVAMNFTASPQHQWQFILLAVSLAKSDDELGSIAAGPLEHLLGLHGGDFIEHIEEQASINPKFGKALTGVWKHMMTDEVWSRIQALQAQAKDQL